ncbi:MAG TPA: DUF1559 domain-containing protein [Isosphaeraceae bacterium]|nr:DUF1559 domain-containing protein [Isosphaeraceae bacterium]
MSRLFKGILIWIAIVFLLSCIGIAVPGDVTAALLLGWGFYLARVLPKLRPNWGGVSMAVFCLVAFTAGLHAFLGWVIRHWQHPAEAKRLTIEAHESLPGRRWKPRWTSAIVALIVLTFFAGMAATGFAHQLGWLLTSTQPLIEGGFDASKAARRAQSANNLKQIGLAASNLQERDEPLFPGCTVDGDGELLHSWMTLILPFEEQQALYDQIDLKLAWDHPRNAGVFKTYVMVYQNPGFPDEQQRDAQGWSLTEYAGNVHVLGGPCRVTFNSITDGTSNTILAGEIVHRFPPWGMPGNWRDPARGINRSPAGFGGPSVGGANIIFVDGSVRFIKNTVDPKVLEALGTPRGGEAVKSDDF